MTAGVQPGLSVLDALRDAITLHRTYTGNEAAAAAYEIMWLSQAAATEPGPAPATAPAQASDPPGVEILTIICADGLPQDVLDGHRCAVPRCGKKFGTAGHIYQVLGVTTGGREIRACPDHDRADVLGPVA